MLILTNCETIENQIENLQKAQKNVQVLKNKIIQAQDSLFSLFRARILLMVEGCHGDFPCFVPRVGTPSELRI